MRIKPRGVKSSNEHAKHGSSDWSSAKHLRKAGYLTPSKHAIHLGFFKPSWGWKWGLAWNEAAAMLICAGPRAGKFTGLGAYAALPGFSQRNKIILDVKGEWYEIARNQAMDNRKCAFWTPFEREGVPHQHRINPTGHIRKGSKRKIAYIKAFCKSSIPESGGGNAKFFELSAQDFGEGIAVAVTDRDGELILSNFYEAILLLQQDTEEAHKLEFLMFASPNPQVRNVQKAIQQGKTSSNQTFQSIMAQLKNAFACLSDPHLSASISPPYDMTLEEIVCEGKYNLYLMPDSSFLEIWSPILRVFYESLKEIKEKNPDAPDQDWWLDECHLLAPFPLIAQMVNFGAGLGIRPIIIVQSFSQLDDIAPNGSSIIPAGCGVQIYFAIREIESAEKLSRMLGMQTLRYNDTLARGEAKLRRKRVMDAVFGTGDPITLGRDYRHYKQASEHRSEMERPLLTASEIMRLPKGTALMFGDGLPHPVLIYLFAYFERLGLAGLFFPHHKYSDDLSKVRVKTWWGHRMLKVRREPVPEKYANHPQYADGTWEVITR